MPQMPPERLQTAFFTQFPPFPIIPDNTVILKSVIPAQAGIRTVRFRFFWLCFNDVLIFNFRKVAI
ncbi:hypothetical protein CJS83_10125 [Neisseria gonorrhoeae]